MTTIHKHKNSYWMTLEDLTYNHVGTRLHDINDLYPVTGHHIYVYRGDELIGWVNLDDLV